MESSEILQIEGSQDGIRIKALLAEQERCQNRNMWPRWIEIEREIMEICGQGSLFPEMLDNLLESDPTHVSGVGEDPLTEVTVKPKNP